VPALLELEIHNFRSLQEATVEFGDFNVLVGPNGSGKSNLLDVIRFIGDSVRADLGPALDMRGGFDEVCFRAAKVRQIAIRVTTNVTSFSSNNALDVYELKFSMRSLRRDPSFGVLVRRESFKFKRTQRQGRRITIDGSRVEVADQRRGGPEHTESSDLLRPDSLGLSTLPRLSDEAGGIQIRQIADLFASFRVFDVNVDAARRPAPFHNTHSWLLTPAIWRLSSDTFTMKTRNSHDSSRTRARLCLA
jgi:predicted ATPase